MKLRKILGIDIGGSGVKGAIVDTKKGELITERYRIPPQIGPLAVRSSVVIETAAGPARTGLCSADTYKVTVST